MLFKQLPIIVALTDKVTSTVYLREGRVIVIKRLAFDSMILGTFCLLDCPLE